jgi:hypothetical protein
MRPRDLLSRAVLEAATDGDARIEGATGRALQKTV